MGVRCSSLENWMPTCLKRRPRILKSNAKQSTVKIDEIVSVEVSPQTNADVDSHSVSTVKTEVSKNFGHMNVYTSSPECSDDDDPYFLPSQFGDSKREGVKYEKLQVKTRTVPAQGLPPPLPVRLQPEATCSKDGYLTIQEIQTESNSDEAVEKPVYSLPEPNSRQRAKADRDYEASYETDMSFKRGDIMQLDRNREVEDWFYATHLLNGKEGYVPRDRITMITSVDVEMLSFFFKDLSREAAEEKLRGPGIDAGTYLLRLGRDGGYVLSLRCNGDSGAPDIRHYRIQVDEDGICRFEGKTDVKPFGSIVDLIKYCTVKPDLKCKLKDPLPREMTLEDLVINFSEIHVMLGQKLGSGNFGTVYAGTLHGHQQVAVKILKAGETAAVDKIRKESETSHRLRHPNVVSLLAICVGSSEFYIITELMSKGSLRTLLQNDTDASIIFRDLMDMAIQVAEGMCYLANEGFVHRDLRAANVLVGDGYITKIADFGLTRRLDSYDEDQNEDYYQEKEEMALPVKWTAPEAMARNRFTVKSDVWSFGILLYEIVTRGEEPYPGMSHVDTIGWLNKGNRMTRPTKQHCPLSLYNVMNLCWMKSPKERHDLESIKESLIDIKMHG